MALNRAQLVEILGRGGGRSGRGLRTFEIAEARLTTKPESTLGTCCTRPDTGPGQGDGQRADPRRRDDVARPGLVVLPGHRRAHEVSRWSRVARAVPAVGPILCGIRATAVTTDDPEEADEQGGADE